MPKVVENLEAFSVQLEQWRNDLPNLVQEEFVRLSQKTVHPHLDFKEQIKELEYALELFVEELNESGLYQLPKENKMLTIPKRQKYLEELKECPPLMELIEKCLIWDPTVRLTPAEALADEKARAERAKQRFEARNQRLEREQQVAGSG